MAVLAAGCGTAQAPSSAELDSRTEQLGVRADLVYILEAEGYERVVGGLGPYGEEAFQDIYFSGTGDVRLTVEPRSLTDADCPALPIPAAEPPDSPVQCTADGDGWERTSGDRHEYARLDGDRLIGVSGRIDATTMDQLRELAQDARPASAQELDALLPPLTTDTSGIVRGDLPETGDGAPNNTVGAGG